MRFVFFLFFLVLFSSCSKDVTEITTDKNPINTKKKNQEINNAVAQKTLHLKAKIYVENWQEYQNMADFIPKLTNTTIKETLFNANQLSVLSQQLKDSIRIENLQIPSFKIRLNVLHNVALRLFDMDSIPSITNKEVIQENNNVLNAFYAINMKINSIVKKEILLNDLTQYNHLFKPKEDSLILKQQGEKTIKLKQLEKRKINKKRIQPLSRKSELKVGAKK